MARSQYSMLSRCLARCSTRSNTTGLSLRTARSTYTVLSLDTARSHHSELSNFSARSLVSVLYPFAARSTCSVLSKTSARSVFSALSAPPARSSASDHSKQSAFCSPISKRLCPITQQAPPPTCRITLGFIEMPLRTVRLPLSRVPPAIASVYRVVTMGAEIQMLDIPARWVVAVVKHEHSFWDRPMLLRPRPPMSKPPAAITLERLVPVLCQPIPRRDDARR